MLRAALFLDFDNLVSGLRDGAGVEVALRFAESPQLWLDRLAEPARCRFLLRRCYMNPAAFLEAPDGTRARFGEFRWAFQAAGFEVVDCPALTRLKNGADIRVALDAMDALHSQLARVDEFTLMSTDADFVPLLLRLRAADRLTRLVAHPSVGNIVRAAADEIVPLDAVAGWLGWAPPPTEEEGFAASAPEEVLAAVRDILGQMSAPLHVPHLGQMVRNRTGASLRGSDFAGTGSLDALLAAAGGYVRREGPGGGHVVRPEWLTPEGPPEPPRP
jgi:hypothetical protein